MTVDIKPKRGRRKGSRNIVLSENISAHLKEKELGLSEEELSKLRKERGERIKLLREKTFLKRRSFGIKHSIPPGTLQYWEDGNFSGLSIEGAEKLVNAFAKEGIWVTAEWLLYETGKEPIIDPKRATSSISGFSEDLLVREASYAGNTLTQELKFFLRLHPMAIYEIIIDDSMEPRFCKGEYVAGIQRFDEELSHLLNKACIIKLKTNRTVVRILKIMDEASNMFKLVKLNNDSSEEDLVLKAEEILSAAAIMWARREED